MYRGLQKRCQKASNRATQRIAAIKPVGERTPVVGVVTKGNFATHQRKEPGRKNLTGREERARTASVRARSDGDGGPQTGGIP
jgi:hypothetical protein